MTVKLLSAWGNQPPGTLYTSDANTEAAMITAKVATATLAGAGPWTPPSAQPNIGQSFPIILAQSAIPMILPSSGTMGANGSLTGLTALPYSVFPQPCFMYFPAGKVFSGSPAGMYYASITAATTATVYNNTYTSGLPQAAIPAVPTPVVDAGPGAYTQMTGSLITLMEMILPAGLMGPSGSFGLDFFMSQTNNANAKSLSTNFGAIANQTGVLANAASARGAFRAYNRNSVARQAVTGSAGALLGSPGLIIYGSVNTAADVTVQIQAQLTTVATDNVALDGYTAFVQPA